MYKLKIKYQVLWDQLLRQKKKKNQGYWKRIPDHVEFSSINVVHKDSYGICDEKLKILLMLNNLLLNVEKLEMWEAYNLILFIGKSYFCYDGLKNYLIYQPNFNTSTTLVNNWKGFQMIKLSLLVRQIKVFLHNWSSIIPKLK